MTDISDDYDPYWDEPDEPDDPEDWDDDGYQAYKDGVATGLLNEDGTQRERDPTDDPEFERREYERYLRRLSPLGRIAEPVRAFIWRMKLSARWLLLTGRATTEPDEPPF